MKLNKDQRYQIFLLGFDVRSDIRILNIFQRYGLKVGIIDNTNDFGDNLIPHSPDHRICHSISNTSITPHETSSYSPGANFLTEGNTPIGKRLPPIAFDALARKHAVPLEFDSSDFANSDVRIMSDATTQRVTNRDLQKGNVIVNHDGISYSPSKYSFDENCSLPDLTTTTTPINSPQALMTIHERTLRYFDCSNPFYVVPDFNGNFFDKLQREKFGRRLVGPPFLLKIPDIIENMKETLPEVRHPIFCLSMRRLNLCFSRFTNTLNLTTLVCLSQYMGATVRKMFNGAKITHLVSLTAQGDKYRAAANLGKPIMSQEWIKYCWDNRFDVNLDPCHEDIIARFKLKPFVGCSLSFIGFSAEEKSHMEEQAIINGAQITDCEDSTTTHIVVDVQNVKLKNINFEACEKNNVIIVKADWFWVSIQVDFCADEKLYLFTANTEIVPAFYNADEFGINTSNFQSLMMGHFSPTLQFKLTPDNDDVPPPEPLSLNSPAATANKYLHLNSASPASCAKLSIPHGGMETCLKPSSTHYIPGEHVNKAKNSQFLLEATNMERSYSASFLLEDGAAAQVTRANNKNDSSLKKAITATVSPLHKNAQIVIPNKDKIRSSSALTQMDLASIYSYNQCKSARQMTALEILNTEKNYVHCLEIILNIYQKPLEECLNHSNSNDSNNLNANNVTSLTLAPSVTSNTTHLSSTISLKCSQLHQSKSFESTIDERPYLMPKSSTHSLLSSLDGPGNETTKSTSTDKEKIHIPGQDLALPGLNLNSCSLPCQASKTPLLDATEIKAIFGYIQPIYDVHRKMLVDISRTLATYTEDCSLGNIVLAHVNDMLKAYPPFINFFHDSQKTLKRCDANKPKFHAFLKICQNKRECGRQSLEDLMIRPVQRLPSLILLLSDLLKHTSESSDDKFALNEAINSVKNVLDHINEGKRKTETQLHMFEIVNDIENCPPNLLSSQRTFVARVFVQGLTNEPSVKGRHLALFLFNDCLEICKRRNYSSHHSVNKFSFPFMGNHTSQEGTQATTNDAPSSLRHGGQMNSFLKSSPLIRQDLLTRSPRANVSRVTTNSYLAKSSSTLSKMASKTSLMSNISTFSYGIGNASSSSTTSASNSKYRSHLPSFSGINNNNLNLNSLTSPSSGHSKSYKHVELIHLSHIKIIGDIIDNQEFSNAFAIIGSSNNFNNDSDTQFSNEGRLMLFCLEDNEVPAAKIQFLELLHKNTLNTLCLSDGRSILRPIHPDEMIVSSPSPSSNGTLSKALKTAKKLLSRKVSRAFSFGKGSPLKLKRTVSTVSSLASVDYSLKDNRNYANIPQTFSEQRNGVSRERLNTVNLTPYRAPCVTPQDALNFKKPFLNRVFTPNKIHFDTNASNNTIPLSSVTHRSEVKSCLFPSTSTIDNSSVFSDEENLMMENHRLTTPIKQYASPIVLPENPLPNYINNNMNNNSGSSSQIPPKIQITYESLYSQTTYANFEEVNQRKPLTDQSLTTISSHVNQITLNARPKSLDIISDQTLRPERVPFINTNQILDKKNRSLASQTKPDMVINGISALYTTSSSFLKPNRAAIIPISKPFKSFSNDALDDRPIPTNPTNNNFYKYSLPPISNASSVTLDKSNHTNLRDYPFHIKELTLVDKL